jgi:hypothetical protein
MFGRLQIKTAQMGRRLVSAGWSFVPTTVEPDSGWAHCMPQQKGSLQFDRLAMMKSGKFPRTVSEHIQRDLNIVQCWYRAKELSVILNKMELILFTEREKVDEFMEPFSTKNSDTSHWSIMYMVVIIDAMVTQNEQMKQRISKAYSSFRLCHQNISKSWGLKPQMVPWLYKDVVSKAVPLPPCRQQGGEEV